MARELGFEIPKPVYPGAAEDLTRLLQTLHEGGILRTLNDLFGSFSRVTEVGLDQLNSPAGRGLISGVLALGEIMTRLPADDMRRIATGVEKGVIKAGEFIDHEPPGTLQVLRMARHPDTRRALGALLVTLQSVGEALASGKNPPPPAPPANET